MTYSPYDFTSKALCTVSEICDIICVIGLAAFVAVTLNSPVTQQDKRIEQNLQEIERSNVITAQYLKQSHAGRAILQPRTSTAQN